MKYKTNKGELLDISITNEEIQERNLPVGDVPLKKFVDEEYGYFFPDRISTRADTTMVDMDFCAGKAIWEKVMIQISFPTGIFDFPVQLIIPKQAQPSPCFVFLSFSNQVPNDLLPIEEIVDNKFAVAMIWYQSLISDDGDFSSGIGKLVPVRSGKLAVWAWGARMALEYLLTRQELDSDNMAVIGHSRLGKAALLAGALDLRFKFVIANNSGCCGASVFRKKQGEHIRDITQRFPFWFAPGFSRYANREEDLPFDQHQLLALIAPRYLYVTSAQEDTWSDPFSEYIGCVAASKLIQKKGIEGLVGTNPHIGYHVRTGTHYLSRFDWNMVMKFIEVHLNPS